MIITDQDTYTDQDQHTTSVYKIFQLEDLSTQNQNPSFQMTNSLLSMHTSFLFHNFYHNSQQSLKQSAWQTIHNSKNTTTKYSIIKTKTCKGIFPGSFFRSKKKKNACLHMTCLL